MMAVMLAASRGPQQKVERAKGDDGMMVFLFLVGITVLDDGEKILGILYC